MMFNSGKTGEDSLVLHTLRQFLQRHYRAQLKRRAQQVQDALVSYVSSHHYVLPCSQTCPMLKILHVHQEFDRNILARLLSEEQDGRRTGMERREAAVADTAWMKRVIEEQLQLEQEREVEFDTLGR